MNKTVDTWSFEYETFINLTKHIATHYLVVQRLWLWQSLQELIQTDQHSRLTAMMLERITDNNNKKSNDLKLLS